MEIQTESKRQEAQSLSGKIHLQFDCLLQMTYVYVILLYISSSITVLWKGRKAKWEQTSPRTPLQGSLGIVLLSGATSPMEFPTLLHVTHNVAGQWVQERYVSLRVLTYTSVANLGHSVTPGSSSDTTTFRYRTTRTNHIVCDWHSRPDSG